MQNERVEDDKVTFTTKNIFKPSSWLAKLNYVNHLVLFSQGIVAVLAEQGAGKTTFIELLQANLDSHIRAHVIKADSSCSLTALFTEFSTAVHLPIDADITLTTVLHQINERKTHVLMIIDDAQYLPVAFLEEILTEIKLRGNGFFHLCIVADSSFVASLSKLDSDLIHTLEPGALTESETKAYLLSVLPSLKRFDNTLFDKHVEKFHQLTQGKIAQINKQMFDYFSYIVLKPSEKHSSLRWSLSILAGAAIALLASSLIWQDQFLPSSAHFSNEDRITENRVEASELPLITPPSDEAGLVSQLPEINQMLLAHRSQIPAWYLASTRQEVQPSPKRVIDVALDEENDSLVVRDRVVIIPKTLRSHSQDTIKHTAVSRKVGSVPLAATKAPLRSRNDVNHVRNTPISTFRQNHKSALVKHPEPSRLNSSHHYTIQLLASRRPEEIRRFIQIYQLNKQVKIKLTRRDDMNWYVLTFGEYTQLDQAHAGVKTLPAQLAQLKPWVRSMEQLKAIG